MFSRPVPPPGSPPRTASRPKACSQTIYGLSWRREKGPTAVPNGGGPNYGGASFSSCPSGARRERRRRDAESKRPRPSPRSSCGAEGRPPFRQELRNVPAPQVVGAGPCACPLHRKENTTAEAKVILRVIGDERADIAVRLRTISRRGNSIALDLLMPPVYALFWSTDWCSWEIPLR